MKLYVLLVLCLAVVHGEKKINLEDIERDNLQSEAQSEEENVRPEAATQYKADKADINAPKYRPEARLISGQPPQEIKYVVSQPDTYSQESQAYQQQQQQQQYSALLASQQSQLPQQFYTTAYQTEGLQGSKSSPQISYQPELTQSLTYQSEIPVGNHIQSYQQKTATQKFIQGIDKGNRYASVAGEQQLYYTVPSAASFSKSQVQPLLHRLATQAAQNVRIPTYTPALSKGTKISYRPQIQYVDEPQYVQPATPTYAPETKQKFTYAVPATYAGLTYSQQSPLYTQPKQAYTQAYYIQPQLAQYYQQPAYTVTPQGNFLSYAQSQPFYIPANIAQQLTTQIYEQQGSHSIAQNYAKAPETPGYTLALPHIPAQNFKSGPVTQLLPVESDHKSYRPPQYAQIYSSGPKSLLDSYTPSRIIADQDSERYRERPLQLESGFLPSKGSYAHSNNQKRKSE